MAKAARKTLYFHFQRMLAHEPGTRLGEDIEELHDMRVATRRMRAALRVFGDHLDPEAIGPFAKALRRTGRALGAVRDLDVFREKAQRYLNTLPAERQAELEPLLIAWQAERDKAREHVLAYLDSNRYARFKEQFGEFLQMAGAGALPTVTPEGEPLPGRVRHVLPVVLYRSLAIVRAYEQEMNRPDVPLVRFHQLRIAFKGLRYTLEFFQEVLGPNAKPLISQVKLLQDHLGDLQDAVVTCNVLRDFLTWGTWGHRADSTGDQPAELVVAPGVAAYLAARQAEIQQLVNTFPPVWEPIRNSEFNRQLAALAADL
jgi:CHAD domain-containing protein